MTKKADLQKIIDLVAQQTRIKPRIGIELGSGLAPLVDHIENAVHIPYSSLPGLPNTSIHGHKGSLVVGTLKGVPIACLSGRVHYLEGASNEDFKSLIRLIKMLGCESIIITNASGSLRKEVGAGELVLINDHINLQFRNPLVGPNDDEFGPRFFAMDDAYDKAIRARFHKAAKSLDIKLHDGVYGSVLGPNFETPAEVRAFRTLGIDAVGMSTIPEVLVARHCGLKVSVIATIVNLTADLHDGALSHDITMEQGQRASKKLLALIERYLEQLA